MKRTNRVASGLVLGLAVAVLGGAAVLRLGAFPQASFYSYGLHLGQQEARVGVQEGATARNVELYVKMAPALIELQYPYGNTMAEKRARTIEIGHATKMAKQMSLATSRQKKRYLQAFLVGYQWGRRWPALTRSDTGR
jgi:hypothetical protein